MRKNWRGEDELLLKSGILDGYAYKPCYSGAGFTLCVALGTLAIFATSSCQTESGALRHMINLALVIALRS